MRRAPPVEGVSLLQLRELIQTEADYLSELDHLCDDFLKPLRELKLLDRADERRECAAIRTPRTPATARTQRP